MGNQIKTTVLLAVMTAVILWVGKMLGGTGGMVIALIFAGGINFFSYWYSDKVVLRMYKASRVSQEEAPQLYGIVKDLAGRAGLPMPAVYIIPQEAPNAFATGRNPEHAVVAVTQGLLKYMDADELKGVIAHELSHVQNRDILIGTIAATMAGAIMMLASLARWSAIFGGIGGSRDEGGGGILGLIAMSIIAPIAALLIQMGISRSREYLADSSATKITGEGESLARALEKLSAYSKKIPMKAEPATAHMFITNPLAGKNMMNLFSTHPPIEDRIARLRNGRSTYSPGRPEAFGGDKSDHSDKKENSMDDQAKDFWNRLS